MIGRPPRSPLFPSTPLFRSRARRWLLALYATSAVLVAIQKGVLTQSNNFAVFRWAAINLLAGTDLYAAHPGQHVDFYKYSPTFALRSEEHTSELQSQSNLVCRLLLEKKKTPNERCSHSVR